VKIGVLGPLEVRNPTSVVEISGARLRVLLTVLALDAPRAVPAATLVDALWGSEPPTDQTNALQSLVSRLRRALGDGDLVQQSAAGYRLAVDVEDIDVHRFAKLARTGRDALRGGDAATAAEALTEALGLWRADAMELADSGQAHPLLARLEDQQLDARGDLAEAQLALGRAEDVVAELEALVVAHPLRERFATLLVQALYAAGRQAEALASYERARALLADQLGVDPSPELQAAHLSVLRGEPSRSPPAANRRTNLRATLTSFVGRDEQLVQIGNLLSNSRLVTIVGPGGAGKTRLAREAAATLATDATDGTWLAELAPVTDPTDVPQTVLGSLGVRETILLERSAAMTARDATTRLIDALSTRSAVLVLDNCEHLIDAAAHLADQLLAECPGLRILATSREPLGIFGESLVVVPPLGQPRPDAEPKEALGFPAIQLFADRAIDVQPGFEVDETTVAAVIEIVRRLDGQPLAIELAAARLRSLPVAEIARRLSDRFRLLTGGSRTAMPRHRTLRAVVEWSWDLLSDSERILAERLAVFSGGVTPRAAAAVCRSSDLDADAIDDLLTSLVDKSLLQVAPSTGDQPRFRMLETIREFGMERMAERSEVGRVRLAHAEHFAALVAEADLHLRSAEQLEWMALLDVERDNILAALKYFGDDGRAAAAIDLVNLLGWYWMTLGSHGEIVTWMGYALDIPGDADPLKRLTAEAFVAINTIAWDVRGSHDEVEAGLTHLKEVSDRMALAPTGAPKILTLLAPIVAMYVGDHDNVEGLIDRALNDDDPWIAAAILTFRAAMAENLGDATRMRGDSERSLAVFRQLGERWGMANSLQVLGQLELMEGNLEAAATAYTEGLDLAMAFGGREDVALMRLRLADILIRLGNAAGAREQAKLALEASAYSGSKMEMLFTNVVHVELARATGDLDSARAFRDDAIEQLRALPAVHPIQGHGLSMTLTTAAKIDLDEGNPDGARRRLEEAYPIALETKDMPIVAAVAVAVAMLAEQLGDHEAAAEILGAASQLRGADDVTQIDIAVLSKRFGGLERGRYADAYARGRSLTRDEAIARADPASIQPS
jgi:predicted ATPase/DNA-binding SARP family transcriptional activator